MDDFGKRLKDALVITGNGTTNRLAKLGGFSENTAAEWLSKNIAHVDAVRLWHVCDALGLRMSWLITGKGNPTSLRKLSKDEMRMLQIALKMAPRRLEAWLKEGEAELELTQP